MREKIGKGGLYKGAPGRTQGQGISWAEKSSFCEQSSKSDREACKQGVPGNKSTGDAVYFKGSRVAQWRWGRRSASEWVRQRLCKGLFSGLKEAQEASTCGSQGLFPGFLVSSHHASHHRELWSLFRLLKTQCHHEDPTLLISRKSQHEPSLLTPLDLRVSAFRTEVNFH